MTTRDLNILRNYAHHKGIKLDLLHPDLHG